MAILGYFSDPKNMVINPASTEFFEGIKDRVDGVVKYGRRWTLTGTPKTLGLSQPQPVFLSGLGCNG